MEKSRRFDYVVYGDEQKEAQEQFKNLFEAIEGYASFRLAEGRYKSLLMTSLEEAYAWTGKALRDEAIKKDPSISHSEVRTNE